MRNLTPSEFELITGGKGNTDGKEKKRNRGQRRTRGRNTQTHDYMTGGTEGSSSYSYTETSSTGSGWSSTDSLETSPPIIIDECEIISIQTISQTVENALERLGGNYLVDMTINHGPLVEFGLTQTLEINNLDWDITRVYNEDAAEFDSKLNEIDLGGHEPDSLVRSFIAESDGIYLLIVNYRGDGETTIGTDVIEIGEHQAAEILDQSKTDEDPASVHAANIEAAVEGLDIRADVVFNPDLANVGDTANIHVNFDGNAVDAEFTRIENADAAQFRAELDELAGTDTPFLRSYIVDDVGDSLGHKGPTLVVVYNNGHELTTETLVISQAEADAIIGGEDNTRGPVPPGGGSLDAIEAVLTADNDLEIRSFDNVGSTLTIDGIELDRISVNDSLLRQAYDEYGERPDGAVFTDAFTVGLTGEGGFMVVRFSGGDYEVIQIPADYGVPPEFV